jgi:hypothetical protein
MTDISAFNQLRKYVKFTYGVPTMDEDNYDESKKGACCDGFMLHSIQSSGSSHKRRQQSKTSSINLYEKPSLPANKVKLSLYVRSFF